MQFRLVLAYLVKCFELKIACGKKVKGERLFLFLSPFPFFPLTEKYGDKKSKSQINPDLDQLTSTLTIVTFALADVVSSPIKIKLAFV